MVGLPIEMASLSMSQPPVSQLEVTRRFLLRFADLMSNGANSANLLLAAELLEAFANRANAAEEQCKAAQARLSALESRLAAIANDELARLPISIVRMARTQFEFLSGEFERSGNLVSHAMCEASASMLDRYLQSSLGEVAPVQTASERIQNRCREV